MTERGRGSAREALLALAVLAVLAATGCQARLALDVVVEADGAGTLAVALGADAALREEARSRGADPLDGVAATGSRLAGAGWTVEDTTSPDGGRQVRLSTTFAGPEEFNALAADLAAALAAPEAVLLEDLRLVLTPDLLRLDGLAALALRAPATDLGLDAEDALALLAAEQPFVYEITVQMPGEVIETTGTHRPGDGVRWTVAPGEEVSLLAVAERPRESAWVVVAAGVIGGLVALVGLVLLRRRRRRLRRLRALRARSMASWR